MQSTRTRESDVYALVLGKIVVSLRERKGWNQHQLAAAAGLTQSTISRIERGQVLPDAFAFTRLAQALDHTPGQLHGLIDQAMQRARRTAAAGGARHLEDDVPWWQAALGAVGMVALAGLVTFAVAAAIEELEEGQ